MCTAHSHGRFFLRAASFACYKSFKKPWCACPVPCVTDGPGVCVKIPVLQVPPTQISLGHSITLLRNKKPFPTTLFIQPFWLPTVKKKNKLQCTPFRQQVQHKQIASAGRDGGTLGRQENLLRTFLSCPYSPSASPAQPAPQAPHLALLTGPVSPGNEMTWCVNKWTLQGLP